LKEHPTIAAFQRKENQLLIGGIGVERLAERVGNTPLFAYDRRLLDARIAKLRATLPRSIALSYAIKANPMPAMVQHLSHKVDAFDVASALEMKLALDTQIPPHRISFAGPGKTLAELRQAVASGITIEMESMTQAQQVAAIGASLCLRPRVALRVNPNFEVRGSGMRMGGGPQQFGVDAEMIPELLAFVAQESLDFVGFHIFAGSQNLRAEILVEAQRKTVDLALELAGTCPVPIRYLNIGGGFGIPYSDRDAPLNLDAIGSNLTELLEQRIRPTLGKIDIVVELGRYIVGECGVYITKIIDRKVSRGKTFLVVDGGLHHQLAATGNLGQVIRRNYPVAIANRMAEEASEAVTVVGCLCTPLDLLGDNVTLPPAKIGDYFAIFQAGAYGLTASPTAFLGHALPPEVLVGSSS
jgi:diaminopimelate decarboxylase